MPYVNTQQTVGGIALIALGAALLAVDQTVPQAGLWALLVASFTTGFFHGALDAQLLLQRAGSRWLALAWGTAYLLVVLGLGWLLSRAPGVALAALLLMSLWHFGEGYGRWSGLTRAGQVLTRIVVGGAPVMLPLWLSPQAMAGLMLPYQAALVWQWFAAGWLVLVVTWLTFYGLKRWRLVGHAWAELLAIFLLNALLSPMMAFALYFGAYHAPVHMWRVWRGRPRDAAALAWGFKAIAFISVLTILLGIASWRYASLPGNASQLAPVLNWLIIALAALTLPHLVLIGACSSLLSRRD
jgi:beta-carotene 15,15'-dioxygenase